MEQIFELITTYGLEAVLIALLVNILTGFSKMPIKTLAKKLKDYTKVTKFIVFLPILFGFLLTFCYENFIQGSFAFDRGFITLWLTSSSLSLTFYAVFEKIFPSKKKLLTECEIKTSETILENIRQLVETLLASKSETAVAETVGDTNIEGNIVKENVRANKIILRGKCNAETKIEK